MADLNQAMAALNAGDFGLADQIASDILKADPGSTNAVQVKALVLRAKGDEAAAIKLLKKSLKPGRKAPGAWNLLASLLMASGDSVEALQAINKGLAASPTSILLFKAKISVLAVQREFSKGQDVAAKLLDHSGASAEDLKEVLVLLATEENHDKPLAICIQAFEKWPDSSELRYRAIIAAGVEKKYETAIELLQPLIQQNTQDPAAWSLMAKSHIELDRGAEAETFALRAIDLAPNNAVYRTDLAISRIRQDKFDQAIEDLEQARALNPDYVTTYIQLATIHTLLGNDDEALHWLERAVEVSDFPGAANNLGLELLARGEFERGFKYYAARTHPSLSLDVGPPLKRPVWEGEPLKGRSLFIWGEQALGEQILHFQGVMRLVAQLGVPQNQIVFACDRRLITAFKRILPDVTYYDKLWVLGISDHKKAKGDLVVASGNLHPILGVDGIADYGKAPYLIPDEARVKELRTRYLERANGRPIVGISWGSTNPKWGRQKTIKPEVFGEMCQGAEALLINLQYSPTKDGLARAESPMGPETEMFNDPNVDAVNDVDGFIAQVAACDHILTVSNTTAHVAGAQGVDTHILLAKGIGGLWYWFREDKTPVWYPNITLYRQTEPGDWTDPMARARDSLLSWTRRS